MSGDVEPSGIGAEALRREALSAKTEYACALTIEMIPALVAALLPDGRLEIVNRAFSAYTGLTPAEKNFIWTAVLHPDDCPEFLEAWRISCEEGVSLKAEARFRRSDGAYRWFLVNAEASRDDRGNITRWHAVCLDIDERKRAEAKARLKEGHVAEAQRLIKAGSFVWNISDGEIFWSQDTALLLGHDIDTKPTLALILKCVHSADAALVEQSISRAAKTHEDFDLEYRLTTRDNSTKHIRLVAQAFEDEHRRLLFNCAVVDVTTQSKREQDLRLNEQRYRELFDCMPVAVFEIDAGKANELLEELREHGVTDIGDYIDENHNFKHLLEEAHVIKDVNKRAAELFGVYSSHELVGLSTAPIFAKSPTASRRAIESRFRRERSFQEEVKLETFDGRIIDALLTVARPGEGDRTLVALVDISERVRVQERLQQLRAEFAHAARISVLGELAASIAHEVNQPITGAAMSARAGLRWLDKEPADVAKARNSLERIIGDTTRAAEVIRGIRALAKKAGPRNDWLDINEAVHDVVTLTLAEAANNDISVQTRLADDLPMIEGDRVQLQQVILNLVMNAIEAMSGDDGGPRELLISSELLDAKRMMVAVKDSGPGLDKANPECVFDAFYTTKPSGLGIGLSICRSIVEAHGGQLWAVAAEPRGAIFQFSLAREKAA
ncbi:PAS domain-containing sensor histidine kinase [Bradyrhizobium sp.]|jgi:PAS domain S-box-containing protein|uniref:PAS domain-containing sensor histidine kinase n=1 Tax=Bradyrhizobium sp. TaxID=376 RepID=UPI003C1A4B54